MTKKHILCYGDSNTWGCIGRWFETTVPSERYDEAHRWPCILQAELGEGFEIISEGLGGRTTIYTSRGESWKNGEPYLLPCLHSHRPLDLVILMLGTNDLHDDIQPTPEHLGDGITRLIDIIQGDAKSGTGFVPPKVMVLAPVEIRRSHPDGRVGVYDRMRGDTGRALSLAFPEVYARIAEEKGCYFLNAAAYAEPGEADGVHFTPDSHIRLGKAVAEYIFTNIFPKQG